MPALAPALAPAPAPMPALMPAPVPGPAPACLTLLTQPPARVYQCIRIEGDALSSSIRVELHVRFTGELAALAAVPEPLEVDVLNFDGSVPTIFCADADAVTGAMHPVPRPSVEFTKLYAPGCIAVYVLPRTLPLSSANSGRPLRLVLTARGTAHSVVSEPFMVVSKQTRTEGVARPRTRTLAMRAHGDALAETRYAAVARHTLLTAPAVADAFWSDINYALARTVGSDPKAVTAKTETTEIKAAKAAKPMAKPKPKFKDGAAPRTAEATSAAEVMATMATMGAPTAQIAPTVPTAPTALPYMPLPWTHAHAYGYPMYFAPYSAVPPAPYT